jgi:hypothetical protein
MMTDVSDVQASNAQYPISVTESGMMTDVSDVQSLNAKSPILVTESGMVNSSDCLPGGYLIISFISLLYNIPFKDL